MSSSTSECSCHGEETRFFCHTCDRRVCDECIVDNCRNHNIAKAKRPIEEKRASMTQKLHQFQRDYHPRLSEDLENMAAYSEQIQVEIDSAMIRADQLKETIDKVCSKLVQELITSKQENDNFLKREKEDAAEIETFISESLLSISSADETRIDDVERRLQEMQSQTRGSGKQNDAPRFVTSTSKDTFSTLKSLFGEVSYGLYEKISDDDTSNQSDDDDYLVPVAPAPEIPLKNFQSQVCLKLNFTPRCLAVAKGVLFLSSESDIHEVKSKEKIVRLKTDANFQIKGFIALSTHEILIFSELKPGIFKLHQKHRHPLLPKDRHLHASSFVDPTPYHSTCMSLCQSEKDILVALQSNSLQDMSVKLQKYPLYQDTDFKFENVPLSSELNLTKITGVAETPKGDVCFIDETSANSSYAVCVDSTGKLCFRYPADDKIKRYFVGICVLKSGVIALADSCIMSGIHLIGNDGKLIYLERKQMKPTCLATEEDFIWVGYCDKTVEKLAMSK